LCDGEHCDAALLNQLAYWHGKGNRRDGWIYKTYTEWRADLLDLYGEKAIQQGFRRLLDKGFVKQRRNPDHGYDRTYQYELQVAVVQAAINVLPLSTEHGMTASETPPRQNDRLEAAEERNGHADAPGGKPSVHSDNGATRGRMSAAEKGAASKSDHVRDLLQEGKLPWEDAEPHYACYLAWLHAQGIANQHLLGVHHHFVTEAKDFLGITPAPSPREVYDASLWALGEFGDKFGGFPTPAKIIRAWPKFRAQYRPVRALPPRTPDGGPTPSRYELRPWRYDPDFWTNPIWQWRKENPAVPAVLADLRARNRDIIEVFPSLLENAVQNTPDQFELDFIPPGYTGNVSPGAHDDHRGPGDPAVDSLATPTGARQERHDVPLEPLWNTGSRK